MFMNAHMQGKNKMSRWGCRSLMGVCCIALLGCADVQTPEGRSVNIPPPGSPSPRERAINEGPDGITRVPLGKDALIPKAEADDPLPSDIVGPYELRGETVAAALQLILAGYDMPLAFETDQGLERRITVSNLRGTMEDVVNRVCGLGDLYCSYEKGTLVIKDTETFVVALPPLGEGVSFADIATGLEALTGVAPTIDNTTRTMIYTATHRNSKQAADYFKRLRGNTAMVVYETYIWEVQLDSINSAGIRWENLADLGTFNTGISLEGSLSNQVGTPISIGLPTKGPVNFAVSDIVQFISEQGAVKTISQPQLTVLSGSSASLRVAETINYIESLSRTTDDQGDQTVATTAGTVDTGFTLSIASSWDDSTVYGAIDIDLQEFLGFETFDAGSDDTLQLPRTSERTLSTQVRVRPGDSILIAGLVRERDEFSKTGPGMMTPIVPTGRTAATTNTELVFLLRPRVIVYETAEDAEKQRVHTLQGAAITTTATDLPMGSLASDLLNPALSSATGTGE